MDGVDGWTFDPNISAESLARDGTGSVVAPLSENDGGVVHAIPPRDLSQAWSFSFDFKTPTAPFDGMLIEVALIDYAANHAAAVQVVSQSDGTPPSVIVTAPGGYVSELGLIDPITGTIHMLFAFDGVGGLTLYQDGVLVFNDGPITIPAATVDYVSVLLQSGLNVPLPTISRVSVPGIP